MKVQKFDLNLVPGGVPVYVHADQYDVGRVYKAAMWDGDEPYVFDGTETVTIQGTKFDGHGFSITVTTPASGSELTFALTDAMTDAAGPCIVSVILSKTGVRIGTANFTLLVQRGSLQAGTVTHSDSFGSIIEAAVAAYIQEHGLVIDDTLSVSGAAADAKTVGDELDELRGAIAQGAGLTTEAKTALLNCIAHIGAWDNGNGQTYYDALYDALMNTDWSITNTLTHCTTSNSAAAVTKNAAYSATITAAAGYTLTGATVSITMGGTDITSTAYSNGVISIASVTGALVISVSAVESVAELVSISAAYTQSGTVHPDDPLSTLKSDLVVTALYDDSSTAAVAATDYTLSGTLTVGTSTVTVTYEGKTTTFSVTVTAPRVPSGYEEVEYIFNTNEMSFSTGVTLSGTGDVVIEASFLPYGDLANAYIVSTRNSSSANTVGMALAAYNSDTINFYAGTSVGIQPTTLDKVKHEVTATITSTGASITDGTLSASDTFTPRVHNVVPLYLFGMLKTDNSVGYPFYGRIYYLKVTENNVDKLELIPCVRLSDGMAGFYDTVSEAFLYDNYFAAAPSAHNTTAEIANPWSVNAFADGVLTPTQSAQCGTTKKYDIPETTSLYPAGILPTETPGSGSRPKYLQSGNVVVFNGETLINHVNEYTSVRRWAKEASGTLTEYKKEWTVDPYNKISFDVDLRYLHDSYMYDYTTGLVFFAGRNTPYYGMRNVSEASA